jgi:hypothetical protein
MLHWSKHVDCKVPLLELLTPSFVSACSQFWDAEALFKASGFSVESQDDFNAIPQSDWDEFIRANTSFENWQALLDAAVAEWTKKQLGL